MKSENTFLSSFDQTLWDMKCSKWPLCRGQGASEWGGERGQWGPGCPGQPPPPPSSPPLLKSSGPQRWSSTNRIYFVPTINPILCHPMCVFNLIFDFWIIQVTCWVRVAGVWLGWRLCTPVEGAWQWAYPRLTTPMDWFTTLRLWGITRWHRASSTAAYSVKSSCFNYNILGTKTQDTHPAAIYWYNAYYFRIRA